jgi:hypothetical protein
MNHQPFETWLLEEKPLGTAEKRELNAHLRICRTCSALAETGLALRSAKAISPRSGFTARFQHRLAAHKIAERRRRLWGLFVLTLGGLGLLGWFAAPFIYVFAAAPVEWLTAAIGFLIFAFTSIHALGEALAVMARVVPEILPPYVWMILISALAGTGLLWIVSIWRFSHKPQGATV